jgi:hypothetical protein
MSFDAKSAAGPSDGSERRPAVEHLERAARQLETGVDEELRKVSEAIHESERKSRVIIPDVPSLVDDS